MIIKDCRMLTPQWLFNSPTPLASEIFSISFFKFHRLNLWFFIAIFIHFANENCGIVRSVQDLNHAIYLCTLLGICAGFVQSKRHGSDLGQIWPPTSTNGDYFLSALTNGLWISIYIGTSLVIPLKICIC